MTQPATVPQSIANPTQVSARFGAARLALATAMATTGDPLADAVIAELGSAPTVYPATLSAGIANGRAGLASCPEAIGAFLAQAEAVPAWVDPGAIRRGSQTYLGIGALWMSISLGPGSLAHTYSSPAIASVLMRTANLSERAGRRLAETANWQQQVMRPDGLGAGQPGYVHTLQVRLLHARVRAGLAAQGWDSARLGSPISQLDMLRTWLDFTYVPFSALAQIGIDFTEDEFRDLYHLWQLVAHLLGIEAQYYRPVVDQQSAAGMLALIDAACGEPQDDSRLLTAAMLSALGQRLGPMLGLPEEVGTLLMHAFCRLFHGDAFADASGVARNWTASLLPFIANANRYQRLQERQSQALRERGVAATLASFDQQMAALQGGTTYQNNLTHYDPEGLPRTA